MYCDQNFKTKKALKEAVEKSLQGIGPDVTVFQPGPFGGNVPQDGKITLEGPHYPQPHTWYASAVLEGGRVIKVK